MSQERQPSKIEDIKHRLYDRQDTISRRHREGILHPIAHEVNASWHPSDSPEEIMVKQNTKFFKRFFIIASIFFIGALGFAGYMFFQGASSVSSDNIDINILGNAFTAGGEELPLQIEIINRNKANLELANLIIEYPKSASDEPNDSVRMPRDAIGTIKAGESVIRNTKVTLYGDQSLIRNVKVRLEYHPAGSNAIFTKEKVYPVTISSAPLNLSIEAPESTSTNQAITLKITATLNTTLPSQNTVLKVEYPQGFTFESAIPAPIMGNNIWDLSNLTQTKPVTINVVGSLIGQDGDQQAFHVYAGTANANNQSIVDVVYNSLLHAIAITKPFLEAKVYIGDQYLESYTSSGGDIVRADIVWANNLPTQITDAKIIAHLSGNAFDKSSVNGISGFYDSANSDIVWDKNTTAELSSIEPGENGRVSFSFKPLSFLGVDKNLKNPQVVIEISIRGNQPSAGSTFASVDNFEKKIVRIVSDFQLAASGSYFSGAFPPQAEQETRYGVAWTLSNSINTITSAEARAILPTYVKWVGVMQGSTENISYNDATREVIWRIGTVQPNTGFNVGNKEASFVVAISPSISQVGSTPQLVKDVFLTGQDSFTGTAIKSSQNPITTNVFNDPAFKPGYERVVK